MITKKVVCSWEGIKCQYAKFKVLNQDTIRIENKMTIVDRWLFRGQRSSAWNLQSSYYRLLKCREDYLDEYDRKKLEKLMLNIYKAQAHAYLSAN